MAVATSILNAAPVSYKIRKRHQLEYEMLQSHLVKTGSMPSLRDWAVLMRENQLDVKCEPVGFSTVLSASEFWKFAGYSYNSRLGGVSYNASSAKVRKAVKGLFTYDGANKREKFCSHVSTLAKRLARDCSRYADEVSNMPPCDPGKSLTIHGPIGTGLAGSPITWTATEMSVCDQEYLVDQLQELGRHYNSFAIQFPQACQLFRELGITNMIFPTYNFLASGGFNHSYVKGFPMINTDGLRSVRSQGTLLEFTKRGTLELSNFSVRGWSQLREKFEISLSEYKQSRFLHLHKSYLFSH